MACRCWRPTCACCRSETPTPRFTARWRSSWNTWTSPRMQGNCSFASNSWCWRNWASALISRGARRQAVPHGVQFRDPALQRAVQRVLGAVRRRQHDGVDVFDTPVRAGVHIGHHDRLPVETRHVRPLPNRLPPVAFCANFHLNGSILCKMLSYLPRTRTACKRAYDAKTQ